MPTSPQQWLREGVNFKTCFALKRETSGEIRASNSGEESARGLARLRRGAGEGAPPAAGGAGSAGAPAGGARARGSVVPRPAASSSYEILALPPPRAARERRTGGRPAPARARGGGLAAACFLPSCLLYLVKNAPLSKLRLGSRISSQIVRFYSPVPTLWSFHTPPAQPHKCIWEGGGAGF